MVKIYDVRTLDRVDMDAEGQVGANPGVSLLSDGTYVVAWTGTVGVTRTLYTQHYDATGVKIGDPAVLTSGSAHLGNVVAQTGGGYIVAYTADDGLHVQKYDNTGAAVGAASPPPTGADDFDFKGVFALSDGTFVVVREHVVPVYESGNVIGYSYFENLAHYDSAGALTGSTGFGDHRSDADVTVHPATFSVDDQGRLVMQYVQTEYDVGAVDHTITQLVDLGTATVTSAPATHQDLPDGGYVDIFVSVMDGSPGLLQNVKALTDHADDSSQYLYAEGATDAMAGLGGDDTYFVNASGQTVVESASAGHDTVYSSVTFTLGDNVEDLYLTGTTAIDGTGNGLNNFIDGNSAANVLTGGDGDDVLDGGTGIDTLIGGSGNDSYFINVAGDIVTENAGEGDDTVNAVVSYTLGANVENLALTGDHNISATGNALDNSLVGNVGSNTLNGMAGADTMTGGAGNDFYYVDNAGDVVDEFVGNGHDAVIATIDYTLGANVEDLYVSGGAKRDGSGNALDNAIFGNNNINHLFGFDGNDTIDGAKGADVMTGGLGDDTYVVDDTGDVVVELSGQGNDTVRTNLSYTLAATLENLVLTGAGNLRGKGNAGDNHLTGNAGINTLTAFDGNDVLDGGAGADSMAGGFGDDAYYVDNIHDVVKDYTGQGTDIVYASVNYSLVGTSVERLTLIGTKGFTATGSNGANVLTGNVASNNIFGGGGTDYLSGMDGNDILDGGTGADTMRGGLGDDTFYVDNAGDVVQDYSNQGYDTIYASVSYTLSGTAVENLILTGTADIDARGHSGDNSLTGNSGNNILLGYGGRDYIFGNAGNDTIDGGSGIDYMAGGTGNDTYYVDDTQDTVVELANGGTDLVYSSVTFHATNVETVILTGTASVDVRGDDLVNTLTGNSGDNLVEGRGGNDHLNGMDGNDTLDGGAGTDVMAGGTGDDIYYIDTLADVVLENAGEGSDQIYASITYTLTQANVENLRLAGGTNINGTGNSLDNTLHGNGGNNTLSGLGGNDLVDGKEGNDILIGGTGADTFKFFQGSGVDVVSDFSAVQGDSINIHAYSAGTVEGHGVTVTQSGLDTIIDLGGGNTITVSNAILPDVYSHIVW